MKNLMLLTSAILMISPLAFSKPNVKLNQSLKSLVEFNIQKMAKKLNSPIEPEPEPVVPPIRIGKVKYTIFKGTFSKTEEGWDYAWSNVCTRAREFYVHSADTEWSLDEPGLIDCETTINGKVSSIYAVLFGVEGNSVIIDSGEPARKLSAYALYGYTEGKFDANSTTPELPVQLFASASRPTSSFIMISRPPTEITCEGTLPPVAPESSPSNPDQPDDNFNCTAKWNEVFRVTAEIED